MTIIDLLKWRPVWAPEDETGTGGDPAPAGDNTGGGDPAPGGAGGEDTADDAGNQGDGGESPDTVLNGGTADGEDNPGEDEDGAGDDDAGDGDDAGDVPEEYDFSEVELPEGMELDSELAAAATPVFKDLGLTQDQANKLVDLFANHAAQQAAAQMTSVKDMIKGWVDTAKADEEIGGANWDENVRLANTALREFGTPELIQDVMVNQGIGNHPEVIRFAARIGKHIASDNAPTGNSTDGDPVPTEASWYGDTTPAAKQR